MLFNEAEWNINQEAKNERGLREETRNQPYLLGIFCIEKTRVKNKSIKEVFENVTNYLLENKKTSTPFNQLLKIENIDDYYVLIAGKQKNISKGDTVFFGSYDKEIRSVILKSTDITEADRKSNDQRTKAKIRRKYDEYLKDVLSLYSYIYIPTEVSISEFSRIEKNDIQKLTGTNVYLEIEKIITKTKLNDINRKLADLIDNNIAKELHSYKFETKTTLKNITMNSLIQKIIEEYFSLRIMIKESNKNEKIYVENLSSGEKRKALIELSKAFLKTQRNNDQYIILSIDEPEASLNTRARFKQFEDLNDIKNISNNIQTIIATHWYGHLSILSRGIVNLIHKKDDKLEINSYDLFNLTERLNQDKKKDFKSLPNDITLKSINDLTQSIISSLQAENPYNWLICEGSSEKIYFDKYFKDLVEDNNLRILPVGGFSEVKKIYEHLVLPLKDYREYIKGKVYCLIDTDKLKFDFNPLENNQSIVFRRLLNDENKTKLVKNNHNINTPTEVEDCLDGKAYIATLKQYNHDDINMILKDKDNIKDEKNNSYYCFDLRDTDRKRLKDFFDEDNGYRKIDFAKKYIAILDKKTSYGVDYPIPSCIEDIKSFFIKN